MRPRESAGPRAGSGEGEAAADKAKAEYWRRLKSGDFVSISDAEAFEAALAAGAAPGGSRTDGSIDYEIGDIRRFALRGPGESRAGGGRDVRDPRGRGRPLAGGEAAAAEPGSYTFVELSPSGALSGAPSDLRDGAGPLYLCLVDPEPGSRPESFELRLYFIPEGIEGGSRDEWIDRGDSWLFLPPPNPEDFLSKDLEFAPYPDLPPIDGRKIVFGRSGPGVLYAEALDTRAPSIIAEYEAEPEGGSAPTNPLVILVEEGWMRQDGVEPEEGGYLSFMLGKRLKPSEIEYWPS